MAVINLPNGPRTPLGEPDPEIVKMCEDALANAKSGQMRACAITWVGADGFSNNWASAATFGMTLLGAMTRSIQTWGRTFDD